MAVTANINLLCNVDETFNEDALSNQTLTHGGYNLTGLLLDSGTTPPVTTVSAQDYTLSSGTKTIDLTALLGVRDTSQDCTGLKPQFLLLINPSGNNAITISGEGANGLSLGSAHTLNGSTIRDTRLILDVSESFHDVDGTHKLLVVTGTGSQSFKLLILLG